MTQGRRVAALALLATGLGGVILAELFDIPVGAPVPAAATHRVVATPLPVATAETADGAQQGWIATLLARPPFNPARRPPAVAAATPHDAIAAGVPRLAGVLVSPNRKLAIFVADGTPKPITASEGDPIGRYRVLSIEAGEVILHSADRTQVLHMSFPNGQHPVAGPVPVAQRTGLAASASPIAGAPDSD